MPTDLLEELTTCLATSNAHQRKHWAERVVQEDFPLRNLFILWHGESKTAQRFMWLIGDICEQDVELVRAEMDFLFSIRNQFQFPGMDRSVAKWLWLTGIPKDLEEEAIDQLFRWMEDSKSSIACKSYSSKAIQLLAEEKRIPASRLCDCFAEQIFHPNRAYAKRIATQLSRFRKKLELS